MMKPEGKDRPSVEEIVNCAWLKGNSYNPKETRETLTDKFNKYRDSMQDPEEKRENEEIAAQKE